MANHYDSDPAELWGSYLGGIEETVDTESMDYENTGATGDQFGDNAQMLLSQNEALAKQLESNKVCKILVNFDNVNKFRRS